MISTKNLQIEFFRLRNFHHNVISSIRWCFAAEHNWNFFAVLFFFVDRKTEKGERIKVGRAWNWITDFLAVKMGKSFKLRFGLAVKIHFSISITKTKYIFKAFFICAEWNLCHQHFLCRRNMLRQLFAILSLHSKREWDKHESYFFLWIFRDFLMKRRKKLY